MTNNKNTILAGVEYLSLLAGVSIIDLTNVLSLVLVIVSLFIGALNLILLVRRFLRDGKIDEDEIKQIEEEVNKLTKIVKESKPDGKHDNQ